MELTKAIDDNWGTPYDLFQFAEYVFGKFDLDAAAEPDWKMCENYIGEEQNALDPNTEWNGWNIWINPPYDIKSITAFVTRALQEAKSGKCITLLLPVKSDQKWFHDLTKDGASFLFIRKRVKFRRRNGLPAIGASFPVMLVRIQSNLCEPSILDYDYQIKSFEKCRESNNLYAIGARQIQKEIDEEILMTLDSDILDTVLNNLPEQHKDKAVTIRALFENQARYLNDLST